MKHLLTVTAILLAAVGLWTHDWRTILASLAIAVIWPLISADITTNDDDLLDELWSDE